MKENNTTTEENTTEEKVEKFQENDKKEEKEVRKEKPQNKIKQLEEEILKLRDDYLRVFAEMENTKRRLKEESVKERMYASQNLVNNLLNPIDMFLKVVNMENQSPEISNFLIGFKMISTQLLDVLKEDGLVEMDIIDKEYNPQLAQAVETVKINDKPSNIVIEVMQKGYMYKDRVLRPAMVKISE